MGVENSKIKYSGEGIDFDKYYYGLRRVADKTTWKAGLLINFDNLDPLITIYIGSKENQELPADCYTHILRTKHEDGSENVIYLKKVTPKQARKYMKIRKPPPPPEMPNFVYKAPQSIKKKTQTTAEQLADGENKQTKDIMSAIEEAEVDKKQDVDDTGNQKQETREDFVKV